MRKIGVSSTAALGHHTPNRYTHPRIHCLHSTSKNDEISSSAAQSTDSVTSPLIEKWDQSDRFDRWKFLQELLDDLEEDDDTEELLCAVLKEYPLDKKNDGVPIATSEQKQIVRDLVATAAEEEQDPPKIRVLTNDEILRQVEALIPDPQEDEDGFKSAWDAVLEIHGQEMVKVNEEAATARWKALCIVARVLIHYEFLSEGIQKAQ
ncbi:expressed unknown protein [Seminavis robusta]|uniref:Uncharacterized protein n=1 Tax=Seminavis robusta TaxID=568900 RepID=A0A9N8DRJ7_9STRA|nr:expressed unknown protein [Seminavis robusta]|eukprot:Sro203_g085680.1 n/a (207) ;mRNA; r:77351-77971